MNGQLRTAAPAIFTVVGVVLLTLLTTACNGCPDDSELVNELPRQVRSAKPVWDSPLSTESAEPVEESNVVEIHLDVSIPMAGFLPDSSRQEDYSTLHVVASVAEYMAGAYRGVTVEWRAVGDDLAPMQGAPRIRRELFDGGQTRLDLSIESMLADFRSGRLNAVALVSDLMAKDEHTGIIGPLVITEILDGWLRSEKVRTGVLHAGLLGMKARYWGIPCPFRPSDRCWFNERLEEYVRLDGVSRFPLYVLVLGRGADNVASVVKSLQRDVVEFDPEIEAQWELLTHKSLGVDVELSCTADDQFALASDQEGWHHCVRPERITLSCGFENGFWPGAGHGRWSRTSTNDVGDDQISATAPDDENGSSSTTEPLPEPPDLRVEDARLYVDLDLDCDKLHEPDASLKLSLDVGGTVDDATAEWSVGLWAQQYTGNAETVDNAVDWTDWSSGPPVPGKTPQLENFVNTIRNEPDRYEVEFPTILRFRGCSSSS